MSTGIIQWSRQFWGHRHRARSGPRRVGGVRNPGIIGLARRLREGHEARVRRAIADRPRFPEVQPRKRSGGQP